MSSTYKNLPNHYYKQLQTTSNTATAKATVTALALQLALAPATTFNIAIALAILLPFCQCKALIEPQTFKEEEKKKNKSALGIPSLVFLFFSYLFSPLVVSVNQPELIYTVLLLCAYSQHCVMSQAVVW